MLKSRKQTRVDTIVALLSPFGFVVINRRTAKFMLLSTHIYRIHGRESVFKCEYSAFHSIDGYQCRGKNQKDDGTSSHPYTKWKASPSKSYYNKIKIHIIF